MVKNKKANTKKTPPINDTKKYYMWGIDVTLNLVSLGLLTAFKFETPSIVRLIFLTIIIVHLLILTQSIEKPNTTILISVVSRASLFLIVLYTSVFFTAINSIDADEFSIAGIVSSQTLATINDYAVISMFIFVSIFISVFIVQYSETKKTKKGNV